MALCWSSAWVSVWSSVLRSCRSLHDGQLLEGRFGVACPAYSLGLSCPFSFLRFLQCRRPAVPTARCSIADRLLVDQKIRGILAFACPACTVTLVGRPAAPLHVLERTEVTAPRYKEITS